MDSHARAALHNHRTLLLGLESLLAVQLDPAISLLSYALAEGHKILFCGNGGSACDSMHLSTELVVRFAADRKAYPAIALSADSAVLTACGNDYGFTRIFSRQVRAHGQPGDVLVAISTSGKSANVLEAIAVAKSMGLGTLGLSGATRLNCDVDIAVPGTDTARLQEMHILVGHLLIDGIERRLPA